MQGRRGHVRPQCYAKGTGDGTRPLGSASGLRKSTTSGRAAFQAVLGGGLDELVEGIKNPREGPDPYPLPLPQMRGEAGVSLLVLRMIPEAPLTTAVYSSSFIFQIQGTCNLVVVSGGTTE